MKRIWLALALISCGAETEAPPATNFECDGASDSQVMVMRTLTFARATEDGVSEGFDLDGVVSGASDRDGCFNEDYTNPDGVPGIDNAFARLLPVLELTEAAAIEPLIQSSINDGSILITLELDDLDDPFNDACVDVRVSGAVGDPVIGADDRIVPGQTFEVDPTNTPQEVLGAQVVDGELLVDVPEFSLSVNILNALVHLRLTNVILKLNYEQETGLWQGQLAGGLDSEELLALADTEGVDDAIADTVEGLLDIMSDLAPNEDGVCEQLSVTLQFEAASAFYY